MIVRPCDAYWACHWLRVGTSDRQTGHISLQKTRKTGLPRNVSNASGALLYHFAASVMPRGGTVFFAAAGAVSAAGVAGRVEGSEATALVGAVVGAATTTAVVAVGKGALTDAAIVLTGTALGRIVGAIGAVGAAAPPHPTSATSAPNTASGTGMRRR